jgi:hypothetical protein
MASLTFEGTLISERCMKARMAIIKEMGKEYFVETATERASGK